MPTLEVVHVKSDKAETAGCGALIVEQLLQAVKI